jgi:aspartyl-tRNA(Asn)/glutamyl-tRNA(Gln) amidotransferase subunit B
VLRVLNERSIPIEDFPIDPPRMARLVSLRLGNELSSTGAQEVFDEMLGSPDQADEIARRHNLIQVSDEGTLIPVVEKVLADNTDKVAAYLDGKTGLLGFFIGQVMRSFDGSPDPNMVRTLLEDRIQQIANDSD